MASSTARFTPTRLTVVIAVALLTALAVSAQPSPVPDPGALRLSPDQPLPGDTIRVSYDPPVSLADADSLALRARFRSERDAVFSGATVTRTVASLERTPRGAFRGAFVLPDTSAFALLAVASTSGDRVDTNLRRGWPLLAHDARGQPRPEAYRQHLRDLEGRDYREGVRVARRYVAAYSDDPQAWAFLWAFEDGLGVPDSARLAARSRRVQALDGSVSADPDPDRAAALAWLADGEVGERWTTWLYEHAPAHPMAVQFRAYELYVRFRDEPETLLDAYEELYEEVGPAHPFLLVNGFGAALRTGRREAILRWADRRARAQPDHARYVAEALAERSDTRTEGLRRLGLEMNRALYALVSERDLFATAATFEAAKADAAFELVVAGSQAQIANGEVERAAAALEAAMEVRWDSALHRDLATALEATGDDASRARVLARIAVDPGTAAPDSARAVGRALVEPADWEGLMREAQTDLVDLTLRSAVRHPLDPAVVLDRNGGAVALADVLAGAPATAVVLYSRHCGFSVRATPAIDVLRRKLEAEGAALIVVADEPPSAEAEAFFDSHGYGGPVYYDANSAAARAFGSYATPHYFITDRRGDARFRLTSLEAIPRQVHVLSLSESPLPPAVMSGE